MGFWLQVGAVGTRVESVHLISCDLARAERHLAHGSRHLLHSRRPIQSLQTGSCPGPQARATPTPPPQLFLAFNATAHSLVANSLSRRAEGRAAEVLARLAQLAVALSIPVAVALFVGRGLLPDLFTGGSCLGAWSGAGCGGVWCKHRGSTACPPCTHGVNQVSCPLRRHDVLCLPHCWAHPSPQTMRWCAVKWRTCCPCCWLSW